MPETRHRTVIEIAIDDRAIRGLDETIQRAFNDKTIVAFGRAIDAGTRSMAKLVRQTEQYEKVLIRIQGLGTPGGGGGSRAGGGGVPGIAPAAGGGGGGGGGAQLAALNNLARAVQELRRSSDRQGSRQMGRTAAGTMLGQLGSGAASGTITQALVTAIPWVGPMLGAGLGAMNQFYGEHAGMEESRARTVGVRGAGSLQAAGGPKAFARYGYDRGAAYGQLSTMAQQTGRRGAGLGGGVSEFLMGAQENMGIQQLGGILGAAETAGGAVSDPLNMLRQALGGAVATGIRMSRMDRFFAQIASSVEDLRTRGFDITPESLIQISAGYGAMGFQGESAGRMATQVTRGMTGGLGKRPGIGSLVALEAAGWGQEGVSYHDALSNIQNDPQVQQRIISRINAASGGDFDAAVELHMKMAPEVYGGEIGVEDARRLARAGQAGQLLPGQDLAAAGRQFSRRQQSLTEGAFVTPQVEAMYRNQRAGLGAEMGGGVNAMRRMDMRIAGTVLPKIAAGLEKIVTWIEGGAEAFEEGGISGMMAHMGSEMFQGFLTHIATAISGMAAEITLAIATALNEIPGVNINLDAMRLRFAQNQQLGEDNAASGGGTFDRAWNSVTGQDTRAARGRGAQNATVASRFRRSEALRMQAGGSLRGGGPYRSPDDRLRDINNMRGREGLSQFTREDFPGTEWDDTGTVAPMSEMAGELRTIEAAAGRAAVLAEQNGGAREGSVGAGRD